MIRLIFTTLLLLYFIMISNAQETQNARTVSNDKSSELNNIVNKSQNQSSEGINILFKF